MRTICYRQGQGQYFDENVNVIFLLPKIHQFIGLVLGLWCLTPLSTIFQKYLMFKNCFIKNLKKEKFNNI